MSNSKVKHILKLLRSGELDGIVCVDMLGEGYDFLILKLQQYMFLINRLRVHYSLLVDLLGQMQRI